MRFLAVSEEFYELLAGLPRLPAHSEGLERYTSFLPLFCDYFYSFLSLIGADTDIEKMYSGRRFYVQAEVS